MDSNKIVGNRIKSLRENKSITIEQLAEQTDLAIEQIKRIEEGIDLPSLSPLIRISHVLGVRLGTFFDDQCGEGPVICRNNQYVDTISFSNNSMKSRKNMAYHSLSKSKAEHCMSPFIVDVKPVDANDYALSSHEGEEFIYVLEGTMELAYGENKYQFGEGDSMYYDSVVPHHLHGYNGHGGKILAVIYTPI